MNVYAVNNPVFHALAKKNPDVRHRIVSHLIQYSNLLYNTAGVGATGGKVKDFADVIMQEAQTLADTFDMK